jgi:general stress protein YciG
MVCAEASAIESTTPDSRSITMATTNPSGKSGSSNRGFASMDPARQREIASQGGRAAHEKGTAHEFSSEEAREAGRKGGQARSQNRAKTLTSAGGANR